MSKKESNEDKLARLQKETKEIEDKLPGIREAANNKARESVAKHFDDLADRGFKSLE